MWVAQLTQPIEPVLEHCWRLMPSRGMQSDCNRLIVQPALIHQCAVSDQTPAVEAIAHG